jgi:hypothetical protein
VDQLRPAHEPTPRGALAAKHLVPVPAGARSVDPDLEGLYVSSEPAVRSSSYASEATGAPLLAFMAASSSASVATRTMVSTGPNGSAWCSGDDRGGPATLVPSTGDVAGVESGRDWVQPVGSGRRGLRFGRGQVVRAGKGSPG